MSSLLASRLALHRFAILLAASTLTLIFVGGLVTSTGSGLAVPDWPLSFGQVFPPMVGGIFYEHGHRMVATGVGLLTALLASWVALVERRTVVRRLALAALGTVVAQGLLGGLTVLLLLPPAVSVAHACLAQAFLCITIALAMTTAPDWDAVPARRESCARLASCTIATAAVVYVQLIVGAVMRHTGAGLAIPDFPLAFGSLVPPFDRPGVPIHFLHRVGAVTVTLAVAWTAGHVLRHHAAEPRLRRLAQLSCALVAVQVTLGAITIWSSKAVLPTTLHVAVGAALLATTFALAISARRLAPLRRRAGESWVRTSEATA